MLGRFMYCDMHVFVCIYVYGVAPYSYVGSLYGYMHIVVFQPNAYDLGFFFSSKTWLTLC